MTRLCGVVALAPLMLTGCELLLEDDTPTKSKMEGLWQVTDAYNEDGESILGDIAVPIVAFHLSSDNTVVSTAGPMTMHLVYGDNEYTRIAGTIDQVFNYASLDLTGGEFFVGGGTPDRFTLELKLEGLPGQKALTTLLDLIGIGNDYLDVVVYHKFLDVHVEFEFLDDSIMYWTFDEYTTAVYNTKNDYGEYVLWGGWPIDTFSRSTFTLEKRSVSIEDLIEDAAQGS